MPSRRSSLIAAATLAGAFSLSAGARPFLYQQQEQAPAPAASQPDASDAIQVSGGIMAEMLQSRVDPVYPQAAKDAHISGTVVLAAVIDTKGNVENLSVVSGPPELTAAAIDAVKQWTYRVYQLNGQPARVSTTVTVNFHLAGEQPQ